MYQATTGWLINTWDFFSDVKFACVPWLFGIDPVFFQGWGAEICIQ